MVTKAQLKDKVLAKLGQGAIRPNITDTQLTNAIDEAIQFFHDRVEDGTEQKYYKYLITQDDVTRADNAITLPTQIVDILKFIPVRKRASLSIEDGVDVYSALNTGVMTMNHTNTSTISDYYIAKQYIELFKSVFSTSDGFSYSKFSNRVQLDLEIGIDIVAGDYLVFLVKTIVDPEVHNKMYGDRLLLNLATAYASKYEAVNLTKLNGIDIPGGIKFDVARLEKRADEAISKFEQEIENYYRMPLGIYVY
jgi:hypothetical protein